MVDVTSSVSCFCSVFVYCILVLTTDAQQRSHGGEYCDTEVFRAECSDGELIVIEKALYGRMKLGRCVEIDIGYLGCHRDVIALADRRCSGRRVCEIRIPDAEFESTRACLKELKTYLEVVYRCITPESINADVCRWQDSYNVSVMTSHHSSGYLSSGAMSEVPVACNRPDRPWTISVRPGQRINLTLHNFTPFRPTHPSTSIVHSSISGYQSDDFEDDSISSSRHGSSGGGISSHRCRQQYGRIEDNGSPHRSPQRICGTEKRTEHLLTSRGNTVRIWLDGMVSTAQHRAATLVNYEPPEPHRFLIQYTVVGCPNLDHVTDLAWFQRINDSRAVIQCRFSDARWFLVCHHGNWLGSYGNCSKQIETTTALLTTSTVTTTTGPPIHYAEQLDYDDFGKESEPAARNIPAKSRKTVIGFGLTAILAIVALCVFIVVIAVLKQRRRPRLSQCCLCGTRHQCVEPGSAEV